MRTLHCTSPSSPEVPVFRDRTRLQARHPEGARHRGAVAAETMREGRRPALRSEAPRAQSDASLRTHQLRCQQVGPQHTPAVSSLAAPRPTPRAPHLPRARALLPRPPATLLEPPPPPPRAARPALTRAGPCQSPPQSPSAIGRHRPERPASAASGQPACHLVAQWSSLYISPQPFSPATVSRLRLVRNRHIWFVPSGLSACTSGSQQRPQWALGAQPGYHGLSS